MASIAREVTNYYTWPGPALSDARAWWSVICSSPRGVTVRGAQDSPHRPLRNSREVSRALAQA